MVRGAGGGGAAALGGAELRRIESNSVACPCLLYQCPAHSRIPSSSFFTVPCPIAIPFAE